MSNPKFVLKTMKVSAIKMWKDNPRKNDDSAKKLSEILKTHGVRTPVVVWDKDGVCYKGNTTLKACKLAGITEVPVAWSSFANANEAIAYALADNKASEWAEWDEQILKQLFESKEMLKGNLEKTTGFSSKELGLLTVESFNSREFQDAFVGDVMGADGKKKTKTPKYWFWFEVPDEATFNRINGKFGKTEGKRLHRELDYINKLKVALCR